MENARTMGRAEVMNKQPEATTMGRAEVLKKQTEAREVDDRQKCIRVDGISRIGICSRISIHLALI